MLPEGSQRPFSSKSEILCVMAVFMTIEEEETHFKDKESLWTLGHVQLVGGCRFDVGTSIFLASQPKFT